MTVKCPLCGKEVSNHYYLGQHIDKKEDDLHNGKKAESVKNEKNPNNLINQWETETDKPEKEDKDNMEVNEVPTTDKPNDQPDYIPLEDVKVDDLSDSQINLLIQAKEKGYTKIEDSDQPINQRSLK